MSRTIEHGFTRIGANFANSIRANSHNSRKLPVILSVFIRVHPWSKKHSNWIVPAKGFALKRFVRYDSQYRPAPGSGGHSPLRALP